jgi:hypothetical protein
MGGGRNQETTGARNVLRSPREYCDLSTDRRWSEMVAARVTCKNRVYLACRSRLLAVVDGRQAGQIERVDARATQPQPQPYDGRRSIHVRVRRSAKLVPKNTLLTANARVPSPGRACAR